MDALDHHDIRAAVVPVDLRYVDLRVVVEVAAQLRRIGGLAHQVEFVEDGLLVLGDEFHRPQPPAFRPPPLGEPRERVEHLEIALDLLTHPWAQDLHHHFLAAVQARGVDLGDGGSGECLVVEGGEHRLRQAAVGPLDLAARDGSRERRHLVLQLRELRADVLG